jgi:hypothetical protein
MKALSGYPQWFWLMAKGWKDVENRTWSIPKTIKLPIRIYLHASKHLETSMNLRSAMRLLTFVQVDLFYAVDWKKYQGTIIGEIDITGCQYRFPDENANLYSSWAIPGQYGFTVANPVLYDKPIPMVGHLGFWNVILPGEKI